MHKIDNIRLIGVQHQYATGPLHGLHLIAVCYERSSHILLTEAEYVDANVEGDIGDRSGQIVEGARGLEPLRDVITPAEEGWDRHRNAPTPHGSCQQI